MERCHIHTAKYSVNERYKNMDEEILDKMNVDTVEE